MNTKAIQFMYDHLGRHVLKSSDPGEFLGAAFLMPTKGGVDRAQRLGSGAPAYFMASEGDSILISELKACASSAGFKVIKEIETSRAFILGEWLWRVKAPFVLAIQGKPHISSHLRISKSLEGAVFCESDCGGAFDLAKCRDTAQKIIDMGAEKHYGEFNLYNQKMSDATPAQMSSDSFVKSVLKKRALILDLFPDLPFVWLPRSATTEARIVNYLIIAKGDVDVKKIND